MSNKFLIASVLTASTLVSLALPGRAEQTTIQSINQNSTINGSGNVILNNAVQTSVNVVVQNPADSSSNVPANNQTTVQSINQSAQIIGNASVIINNAKQRSFNYHKANCTVINYRTLCR
ncbi:MAG TPA: hypothetical protein V6C58_23575 [Allocoleopsis sp.]